MSQNFKILIKNTIPLSFTGITSNLMLEDNYYLYDQSGLNQGVVTEFNVRQFLDDPKNEQVSSDFFNYLVNNTDESEFREITESNLQLSNIFKKYYTTSILSGLSSPVSYVNEELVDFIKYPVQDYYKYSLSGAQINEVKQLGAIATIEGDKNNEIVDVNTEVITFSTEDSYYLNISLKENFSETARINFVDDYAKTVFTTVDRNGKEKNVLLIQNFVVLEQPDKNSFWY